MNGVRVIELHGCSWADERGWGMNPLAAMSMLPASLGDIHVVSITPGAVRGNHYHAQATEWTLIFGGKASLFWRDKTQKVLYQVEIDGSGPTFFEIPPNVEHAVMNQDNLDIYLVALSDSSERGTVPCTSPLELMIRT